MVATYPIFPKPATPGANPPDNVPCQDVKRNPAPLEGGNNKNAKTESNKKVIVVKRRGVNKKDMGIFYLRNVESCATDLFPRDIAQKVCTDFTCKGKECVRETCSFMHPCNPENMDRAM
jgi:hypothetical protein